MGVLCLQSFRFHEIPVTIAGGCGTDPLAVGGIAPL